MKDKFIRIARYVAAVYVIEEDALVKDIGLRQAEFGTTND